MQSESWRTTTILSVLADLSGAKNGPNVDDGDDLAGCGRLVRDGLASAVQTALDGGSCEKLDQLILDAYAELARSSSFCWRRLHTDASILSALLSPPLDALAKLDTAIIISGAAGRGRLDLILSIIESIQSEHFPPRTFYPINPSVFQALDPLPLGGGVIQCLSAPPSLATFQSRDYKTPFVLRGYARDWPALNQRPWASTEYLRAVAGPGRVVPVEVGNDYRTDDWTQKLMSWDAFLESLDSEGDTHYLAQHSLLMQFPALRADIEVPDYVYASLPRPPGCEPPTNDEQLVINAWLGPKDTISPAHTDPYYNMYVQVAGTKTVWMAPPSCSEFMYAQGNTSGVNVFSTDQGDHPKFSEHIAVHGGGMTARLEPGDLLYMPAGWWHAMRANCHSFSVSMWF
ncbi:hypothetical protein B0H10DRAFT_2067406 [Mycena sp. CBHHK59/15]|nr:hypothetical protein B0H10DRAFT_2067406 [Mycena sp. CBHHK59/15]